MRRSKIFALLLCGLLCVMLMAACGKQTAEEPAETQPTADVTQPTQEAAPPTTESAWSQGPFDSDGQENTLPAVTVPQGTEPTAGATEGTEPPRESNPTKPTETSQPNQPTETEPTSPEATEPTSPEATEPTQETELDEDELPMLPVF